jgi:hypothetical protein
VNYQETIKQLPKKKLNQPFRQISQNKQILAQATVRFWHVVDKQTMKAAFSNHFMFKVSSKLTLQAV